jgi:hypothetical protein
MLEGSNTHDNALARRLAGAPSRDDAWLDAQTREHLAAMEFVAARPVPHTIASRDVVAAIEAHPGDWRRAVLTLAPAALARAHDGAPTVIDPASPSVDLDEYLAAARGSRPMWSGSGGEQTRAGSVAGHGSDPAARPGVEQVSVTRAGKRPPSGQRPDGFGAAPAL